MKRRPILTFIIATLLLAALLPFVLIAVHPALAGFIHRQTIYRFISSEVTAGCASDMDKTLAIMAYVHLHETHLDDWKFSEDVHVLHDLVRNIGRCDQQANAMAHLLLPLSIDARMVMFPCHSFAEVRLNGTPRLFDPMFNSFFMISGEKDSIATLSDLLQRPEELITRHGMDMETYPRRKVLSCGRPMVWTWLSEPMGGSRSLVLKIIGLYHRLLGDAFVLALNDWYSVIHRPDMFIKARYIHLLSEQEEALDIYASLDGLIPAFFRFQALVEMGRYAEAEQQLAALRALAEADRSDRQYYRDVVTDYVSKLQSLSGAELKRLFRLDDDGLTRMLGFLESIS